MSIFEGCVDYVSKTEGRKSRVGNRGSEIERVVVLLLRRDDLIHHLFLCFFVSFLLFLL